ncbi:hypothetical protein NC653_024961 [Populus alba x Populus x berolinensis]|uniref:Uncharacterized protein n=1 Tax=Populus alba x Populus x berolinensis TaxID=444605 RepID=A0AAD6MA21_9ROSI|nr:hypothetical protein NC653_024959 [Populus alba x Populus x berolinensis]KAJ6981719.1 hypothetical protein NC653_024961 [Populus alba x Populus x berolinensis]
MPKCYSDVDLVVSFDSIHGQVVNACIHGIRVAKQTSLDGKLTEKKEKQAPRGQAKP